MICRPSRDRLALALRRYVAGHATNDDLSDVEVDWRDGEPMPFMAWLGCSTTIFSSIVPQAGMQ